MKKIPAAAQRVATTAWRNGRSAAADRALPEETPVALTYDRVSFAVMMATPTDLRDFAIGFSLSEGIIATPDDITALEIVAVDEGVECRMSLVPAQRAALATRRRQFAGPVGCGLCGIDSLRQTVRPLPVITTAIRLLPNQIAAMVSRMAAGQALNRETSAVHAAAYFALENMDMILREDVGRHNALDKLIGAATIHAARAAQGVICLTSRISIELIQKTAIFGAPILVAVSVPTARAVRAADAAGITLIAVARDDGFEIFSHRERVILDSQSHAA